MDIIGVEIDMRVLNTKKKGITAEDHRWVPTKYNWFEALDYDIECYRCHNFGHIARNYRNKITGTHDQSRENRQA